jgi:hypothetical protein
MALLQTGEQRLRHHHVANPAGTDNQDVHKLQASSLKQQTPSGAQILAA